MFNYIMKNFSIQTQVIDIDEVKNYISDYVSGLSLEARPQFYEDQVKILRASVKSAKNIERDINIFTLCIWEGFNVEMLNDIPCLRGVNDKIVYNVTHRMRNYLSENREFFD